MAVLMVLEVPGATPDIYRRVNEAMGIHGDEDAPDGLISHTAGQTDDGILVADVWESEEQLGRFFEERVRSAFAEAGMPEAQPRILPVHNLIAQGAGATAGTIMIAEVEGLGPDAYDRLIAGMDAHLVDGSRHPAVSHAAAASDRGMLVVDVWESPEAFGRFAEEQIGPAGAAAGLGPIEPRFVPVINRMVGPSAR